MAISNQAKIKRMLQNTVGITASVAVVAVASSFSIAVSAVFSNVVVFENQAYYEVFVERVVTVSQTTSDASIDVEPELPPEDPVRLRVVNQWDDFTIPLQYGYNDGFIEPLRSNQTYTLTVEVQQPLSWRALAEQQFTTNSRTNAVISNIVESTSPTNPLMDLSMTIKTQQIETDQITWSAILTTKNFETTIPLLRGDNQVTFTNIPHQNELYQVAVLANQDGQTSTITSRELNVSEFIEADIDYLFDSLTTLRVVPQLSNPAFTNPRFRLDWSQGQVNQSYNLSNEPLIIDNLVGGLTYSSRFMFDYTLASGQTKSILLDERTITPIIKPNYVLTILPQASGTLFELVIDRSLAYEQIYLTLTPPTIVQTQYEFELIETGDNATLYRVFVDEPLVIGTQVGLVVVQPEPYNYPITLHTFIYQGEDR